MITSRTPRQRPLPTLRNALPALFLSLMLALSGCTRTGMTPSDTSQPSTSTVSQASPAAEKTQSNALSSPDQTQSAWEPSAGTCPDTAKILASERNRASCYHLQPAATVVRKATPQKKQPAKTARTAKGKTPPQGAKASSAPKKTSKKTSGTTTATNKGKPAVRPAIAAAPTREYRTVGLCQPQSLIYARCRTGIQTCRLGDTSPVQWFACARRNGATSATPVAGSVIVLAANAGRGMPTGHPAYVEEARKNANGTWTLRISHTNYDRKCHLDLDATVLFDPREMTASFESGPWGPWAKNLLTLGFILR